MHSNDVILLFPGDNVIGRGLGDIKTPTVSRKQVCISIDPDSKRAFVRSMRVRVFAQRAVRLCVQRQLVCPCAVC